MPHVRFCGDIALLQVRRGRHFICENPFPTGLWYELPWPTVAQQPGVRAVVIDQCRVGQKAPDGKYIKKPTTLIASAPELLQPFQNLRCLGRHQHATTWGHGPVLSKAQKWTWQFAERIVEGIVRLRQRLRKMAYPAVASGPQDPPQE